MHHRGNSYSYSYTNSNTATTSSKYQSSNAHGTSSAFSANANPNEDWTKISDLAERRRIQNRIAQRNYRKKLKRRLEDLERRAASSSASPEQSHAEPEPVKPAPKSRANNSSRSRQSSKTNTNSQWNSPETGANVQSTYGGMPEDRSMFGQQSTRQLSTSPPPFFYPSYPAYSDPYGHSAYSSPHQAPHNAYNTIPQGPYNDLSSMPGHHLEPLPHSLPSGAPGIKRLSGYADDEVLNPLCINYASMAGIDMSASTQPQHHQSQLQTPPLTSTYPRDHSGSTSPAGSLNDPYPLTPEPIRLSPAHITFM
ncbi:hypothetical protein BGW36DRAFT_427209 [Talaromyces proteolyticus]|uniref:BZIP domain-containing protein n=1 Tax=Talaromyces proteolyticus TaxID=1131652 RepID=A0AAD4KS89_9EURO|nr:uncharacterized protein BGW36DRAFT_427209 [Talaromyces proteolyticus]KAH8697242.1 hypothetical protein BGW36DRAFT_427209 [Talaromyces proteolyticus]